MKWIRCCMPSLDVAGSDQPSRTKRRKRYAQWRMSETVLTALRKLSRKQAAHLKLVKRAEKIIGELQQERVGPAELLQVITCESDLKKEQHENLTLGMLLRGFEEPRRSTWASVFPRLAPAR